MKKKITSLSLFFRVLLQKHKILLKDILFSLLYGVMLVVGIFLYITLHKTQTQLSVTESSRNTMTQRMNTFEKEYMALKNQDQYKINQTLQKEIKQTHDSYLSTIDVYQSLVDLRTQKQDTQKMDSEFADILKDLSDLQYASADASLKDLHDQIAQAKNALAAASVPQAANVATSNTPPGNGYSRQQVTTDVGTFTLDIIAGDLNTTRVVVDTASDGDCSNNCPTLPLATYAARSGAYAAINGTFFCPADYPSCAGKTNSFDTLLMNKNKVYFNSSNNVYSTVPAVIFSGNSARFVTQSLQWGRDTSVDAVIAMQPMLVNGGQIVFSSSDDPKYNGKGTRCFIGVKGNTAYIGTIYNATMSDSAHVLHTLGIPDAINLDEGGSTALWFNGRYLAGPGRNLPNAVLFLRK